MMMDVTRSTLGIALYVESDLSRMARRERDKRLELALLNTLGNISFVRRENTDQEILFCFVVQRLYFSFTSSFSSCLLRSA